MGEVYHYRDFEKPAQRWGNTDRLKQIRDAQLVPVLTEGPSHNVISYLDHPRAAKLWGSRDTAPCEYAPEWPFVAPEDDPA
jgi:hypothetical protein